MPDRPLLVTTTGEPFQPSAPALHHLRPPGAGSLAMARVGMRELWRRIRSFTTLRWDFLQRHKRVLMGKPRVTLQLRKLDRKSAVELSDIRCAANAVRTRCS